MTEAAASPSSGPAAGELDPAIAALLRHLWQALQAGLPQQGSLARISKHMGMAMSTLKRTLAVLEDAGFATVTTDDRGRVLAALTADGAGFCAAVFAGDAGQPAAEATSRPTSCNADSVRDDQA